MEKVLYLLIVAENYGSSYYFTTVLITFIYVFFVWLSFEPNHSMYTR